MLKSSCSDTIAKIDIHSAFKRNGLTIKLDGSEYYLVSSWLKASIWNEMKNFRTQLLNSLHPATIKKLEEKIIPPEGVRRKLNGVADGIPPDEEHEILGGEPTDNEWDSDESENESDHETNDTEQLRNTQITDNVADNECASVDPEVEADLACLSRIESMVSMEKKESSDNLVPLFIKIENALCKERQRGRNREKRKRKQQTQVASQSNNVDRSSSDRELDDHNLFDILNE